MRILYKTVWLCLLAVCCCTMTALPATAKVCFVGDPDCASGTEFGNYSDPKVEGENLCAAEGYIPKAQCLADTSKQIGGYCPYNSDYVMCCGNEYVYDSCVYPHIAVDKCGSKYKCQCDPEKYPYTEETCHTQFKYSNPGGTACTQIDAGKTTTTKTLYYSACLCERGLYPYSKEDCQETANADVNGEPCTDSEGNQYWDSCKCSNPPYLWESIDCEFGGKGKACVQGGVYFFKECCSCAAFPAEGERGGEPNDPHATRWDTCDCPRKGRFKITQCEEGWQPNADGSACERISCENAVKLFFSKEKNQKAYPYYAVFTGSKLVNYATLTDAEKAKLPIEQQTYAVGAEKENTKATYGVLAGNVNVSSTCTAPSSGSSSAKCVKAVCEECGVGATNYPDKSCTTVDRSACHGMLRRKCTKWSYEYAAPEGSSFGYNMGCTKAATIYSGAYFGTLGSTADHKMLQEACGAYEPEKTVVPVINFTGTSFPNTSSSNNTIYIYGSELKFNSNTTINRSLNLYNSNISGTGAVFNKYTSWSSDLSKPNGKSATFSLKQATIKSSFYTTNYNYDAGTINIEIPTSYKSSQMVKFTLAEGQEFRATNLYIYPATDTYTSYDRNNGNKFPEAQTWTASVGFVGPSGSAPANVYTNVYIGYNNTQNKRARGMSVQLSGNLLWNVYEGSSKKYIGLSAGSKIESTNYGFGNYARLVFGSGVYKKSCQMRDTIYYIVNRHKGWSCATKRWDEHSNYFVMCQIYGGSTLSAVTRLGEYSCRGDGCGCRSTKLESGCKIEYTYYDTDRNDAGDKPGELLTCN